MTYSKHEITATRKSIEHTVRICEREEVPYARGPKGRLIKDLGVPVYEWKTTNTQLKQVLQKLLRALDEIEELQGT